MGASGLYAPLEGRTLGKSYFKDNDLLFFNNVGIEILARSQLVFCAFGIFLLDFSCFLLGLRVSILGRGCFGLIGPSGVKIRGLPLARSECLCRCNGQFGFLCGLR